MVQAVSQRLIALLSDPRFDDESADDDLSAAVSSLAADAGWPPVLTAMVGILRDNDLATHWYDVVACLFCCDCHNLPLPCDRSYLTAVLYDCLRIRPDLGVDGRDPDDTENLVWSIVHNLKGVSYGSDYDPSSDADVLQHKIVR